MFHSSWRLFRIALLCALALPLIVIGCGGFSVPGTIVRDHQIKTLAADGFTLVGEQKILDMQAMKRPNGLCKAKQNICGMQAGISAGFMLDPQEAFYDVKNPPFSITFGDGKSEYDTIGKTYPIMRPAALPSVDLGVFAHTLAAFWSKSFKHHQANHVGFDTADDLLAHAKTEIAAGRPVLLQVRISAPGFPVYLPEEHLGPRGFGNAHWIVLIGYSANEWLVRDNGGLAETVKNAGLASLLRISHDSVKQLADLSELSDDIKQYLDDPVLPVYLDDWDNSDNDEQLRRDFRSMRAFNLITFSRK